MGSLSNHPYIPNIAAKNTPYYTPAQSPPSGTALSSGQQIPALFQPLSIRGKTFQNRIVVSPMCQYSADLGTLTDWHLTHLGGIIQRGPGLTIIEATSVTFNGRITPEDSGLWNDSQIAPIKRIVDFAHSQNQLIGIQLAHAGRKASTVAPWLSSSALATEEVGGWPEDVVAPSAVPFNDLMASPRELTIAEIEQLKKDWVAAVKRAVSAGIDVIEIHAAHGYLLSSFHSPASNHRTDRYGGSFENRTRLTREIVKLTREAMPESMPLFLRISATDWLEEVSDPEVKESWTVADTVRLAPVLVDLGVDLLDISSGGNHRLQHIHAGPAYQAPFAKAVKKAVGDKALVSTVGSIADGKLAEKQLEEGLDVVMAGRAFQKNPGLVWSWAEDLGVQIKVANQIGWGFKGRGDVSGRKKN